MEYNFNEIEKKWQKYWEDNESFKAVNSGDKEKYYTLAEFPYPSGVGLHLGHVEGYTALDIIARKRRMDGYNVLFPMGWDSFGLPAENYAIKHGIHPKDAVKENIKVFKGQCNALGFSFDWSREFATSDPEYYKWTQWQFLKFYEEGLAYKSKEKINWCLSCKTGISNEDVEQGKCERCGGEVVRKEKDQWMLKMSDYAEELLVGLDDTNFLDRIKLGQINWIGKSTGAEVDFEVLGYDKKLKVYTTRPDTLFGATFMVIAPEHPLMEELSDKIENIDAIKKYIENASKKSDLERTDLNKDKKGLKLEGIKAINPANGEEIDIWTADYVMKNYGTGAIMAVPAHDERDFEFAKKFNISIKPVIALKYENPVNPPKKGEKSISRKVVMAIIKHWKEDKYAVQVYKKHPWKGFVMGGIEENETPEEAIIREVKEESGYLNIKKVTPLPFYHFDLFYAAHKGVNRIAEYSDFIVELENDEYEEPTEEEKEAFDIEWVSKEEVKDMINLGSHAMAFDVYLNGESAFTDDGIMINSDFLNGIDNKEEAIDKMIKYLEDNGLGNKKTNYKLQDWVFSRQRFWGEPIPMINCEHCGWVKVPEKDLPVLLPDVASYEPTDNGESPLASIPEWYEVDCPICGAKAKRETDTMPNWAGSSWYWLRYMDPHNDEEFVSKEALNYWGKVDLYNGGMEHVTRHLLYARFWHRFLYDQGMVPTKEPFDIRISHGVILGADGLKMAKSRPEYAVDPNDIISQYGADCLRMFEMFMGDYEQDVVWNADGLKGCFRFLNRICSIETKVIDSEEYTKEVEISIHQTIKKVSEDIENKKFNTAISALMILLNEYEKYDSITRKDLKTFITLLNPIAPHITEEINEAMGNSDKLVDTLWPIYDENKIIDDSYEMIVQVNGKVRAKINMAMDSSKEEMEKKALEEENVLKFIDEKEIIKKIIVQNKLVNIVVK